MEVISKSTHFNFLKYRYYWIGVSWLLTLMTVYLWVTTGDEKFGVDFRGGTEVVVRFNKPVSVGDIRSGFDNGGVKDSIVQAFENGASDFSIRLSGDESTGEGKAKVEGILKTVAGDAGYTILKEDFVGPVIGEQIRRDAYYAVIFSLLTILIYVGIRFEWRFGLGGIIALLHDVIIAAGICLLTHRQFNAGILAALLTVVGYSINDTIIVYDRIRENLTKALKTGSKRKLHEQTSNDLMSIMNQSINETLSRTILTSMTAFVVCTTLWAFGGGAVSDLSFALMVGILVGTYSSIFVACPTVLAFHSEKKRK